MAYSELIKSFDRIRSYMREFYVYGFKSRSEYSQKSARSYDNEKRRLESWLGDYMSFRQTASGKNVFLSFDTRYVRHNPLYKAFKAKSFTDGEISLHFILLDLLHDPDICMTLPEISDRINCDYVYGFRNPLVLDDSTIRKKLKEYVELGLIETEKRGRDVCYHRAKSVDISPLSDAVSFFSEAAPLGVVGSFVLDRFETENNVFSFKHHDITNTLESEILFALLDTMHRKETVFVRNWSRRAKTDREWEIVPLRIFISVQSGRRYLLALSLYHRSIVAYRLDYLLSVKPGTAYPDFDEARENLENMRKNMWGVTCHSERGGMEHVTFTLHIEPDEGHIYNRLMREKRCGMVTRIDNTTVRFDADVYDASEMIPWIRTFICRISSLDLTNKTAEKMILDDLNTMCRQYGIGGDEA